MACPILLANMACPTWTPTPRMHLGKEDEIITFLRPGGAPVTELATLMQVNNGQILLCGCKCPDSNTKQRVQCVLNLAKDCLVECSQAAREFCIEDFSSCYAWNKALILSSWQFYVFSSLRCCALIEILRMWKVVFLLRPSTPGFPIWISNARVWFNSLLSGSWGIV